MFNYKLTLEYDGSKFYGWQVQPGMRTVQGEVERALQILFRETIRVNVAGRTDSGVHALGQVINFHSAVELPQENIPRSLNGILPHDVVVKKVELVPLDFHARFSALSRQYFYVLSRMPVAVGRHYAFFCKFPLTVEAMREAAQYFLGEHDFRAFCDTDTEDPHYLSHVEMIDWEDTGERIKLYIRANRFLRSMVRIIIGTLIDVGRGKLAPQQVKEILESRKRTEASFTAPPHGLFLEKVFY
ncbi:MAG: tRNA pseudouridine(38-40) synthase TruA [candidate division KSB1 bacterium]|nr:tRNA pseudouridine(38-40) synthase TruA [candidate division KSB1 bacterium]MDZ7303150.1 tRNA pseudouridine(38-40) synthase TruA [candidate division KSB1 bacterium]MDZ7310130.1 tRNA pseudouridine(38-40) synthase TruA [candidate division KSB1 bacterium]